MLPNEPATDLIDRLLAAAGEGRTIIFDLDDTLYKESDYLEPAYQRFAKRLEEATAVPSVETADWMIELYRSGYRAQLLQYLTERFALNFESARALLFAELRAPSDRLALDVFPWVTDFFDRKGVGTNCAIITNGNPDQQRAKIESLPILAMISPDHVVMADDFGRKPTRGPAQELARRMEVREAIYVGDSVVDRQFADVAGYEFVHAALDLDGQS